MTDNAEFQAEQIMGFMDEACDFGPQFKYNTAQEYIEVTIRAAEQAARETALREAEAVLRARAEGHAVSSKDPAKQFLTNWSRLVKETNACADAIATLARSAAAAEAQPAGEGPAGRAKGGER